MLSLLEVSVAPGAPEDRAARDLARWRRVIPRHHGSRFGQVHPAQPDRRVERPDSDESRYRAWISPAWTTTRRRVPPQPDRIRFQAFHLLPYLSAQANVALPLVLNGVSDRDIATRVSELLDAVGLRDHAASFPRELSGGEMQRVAIARALVHRPRLVLADEPTGNLDARAAAQVLALLRERVKAAGAAGILVTHSLAAARSADRVEVLTESGLAPLRA
jgi:ABC-type dipeptide/oligopeptide/nickel transport system ATPase component